MADSIPNRMNEIFITTDKSKLDIDFIHSYLSGESYWAQGRTIQDIEKTIEHSICFGAFHNGKQIGFARVVSDRTVIAYIADVFVHRDYQGKGIAQQIIRTIFQEPELLCISRWMLGTRDAHGLYKKFGFREPAHPERWMEKVKVQDLSYKNPAANIA